MEEILHQLRLVVFPINYKVLYIPGGCLGFLNHQQYDPPKTNIEPENSNLEGEILWVETSIFRFHLSVFGRVKKMSPSEKHGEIWSIEEGYSSKEL